MNSILSYILILLFCVTFIGRFTFSQVKRTKQHVEQKSSEETSDMDEESETEKKESEKILITMDFPIPVFSTVLQSKSTTIFILTFLASPFKEIIIPPPEQS